MAGLQLSGLASGMDWTTIVNQLMQVNQVPQDRLRTQQSTVNQQASALGDLKTMLGSLQTAAKALQADGLFTARAATAADSSTTWKADAAAGAATGTYQVSVSKLATAASLSGVPKQSNSLAPSSDVSGVLVSSLKLAGPITAGNFTVNGTQISVASTDTLGDVFSRINSATGGAVTASYDPTTDAVTFQGTGPVTLGSAGDTSNFLQSLKLFQNGTDTVGSSSALGAVKLNLPIAQSGLKNAIGAVDSDGAGSFSINGTSIAYNVNTDTIQDVLTRINNSGAGVNATYQPGMDQFTLTNASTGDVGIYTSEDPNGFLAAIGLGSGATLKAGSNAEFSVNGGPTQLSLSNTLDQTALGIKGLSVTATTTGSNSFTVAQKLDDVKSKMDLFVSQLNTIESYIADKTKVTVSGTKVTTGLLYGNNEVRDLGKKLRAMIYQPTAGATGSLTRLADLGLDFNGITNTLSVKDSNAMAKALASTQVNELFSTAKGSSMSQLGALLDHTIGINGTLPAQVDRLNQKSQSYDTQIANMQRRLDAQKAALQAQFIQMESAQAAMQQQAKSLTSLTASSSSS